MARTERGLDRVVFFTDAIAAIAITLLILPVVEAVSEVSSESASPVAIFSEHAGQLISFVISFAVIARLWYAHHQLFEHVEAYSPRLILLGVAWAFTIVLLPLPTAITAEFSPSPLTVGFYIGTMLLSSALLTSMTLLVRRSPQIQAADNPVTNRRLVGSAATTIAFAVALVLGALVPVINYWALLLLAVTPIFERPLIRSLDRRSGTTSASRVPSTKA
ncbi:TMEM175 family protein [Naasia lichenicola]|uniref:DUF1211 domain-containing protein n=1 Tax=Naasia lichenicola TaxID=2565933 RepID=A0A4S4FEL0_9MICO|nr:TMEM175 family protein [Naasia lichenicola]THG28589.1 DUF1211 domain-containing protein [Naasia lichenicola]